MKNLWRAVLSATITVLILSSSSPACFDTYLFLKQNGMVYPTGMSALDVNGEYGFVKLDGAGTDLFTGGFNYYYGVNNRLSIQVAAFSGEKDRHSFRLDDLGLRGVLALKRFNSARSSVDLILEHHEGTEPGSAVTEVSTPLLMNFGSNLVVFHPVLAFGESLGLRGHGGLFHRIAGSSVIGIGAEYESAQSSSNFSHRLVDGSAATSLFFGSSLGNSLYLQNEIIKGFGNSANDLAFALTLKVLVQR